MARLIAIDGLDGSGKDTQSTYLFDYLQQKGVDVKKISFPRYGTEGASLVSFYLNGGLGNDPSATNSYAASTFFACDRYISYQTEWKIDYQNPDAVIIANRYTTANAVHQLSKLPRSEWDAFLTWLFDFEYQKLGLPAPNEVIYLEMLPELSRRLIESRCEQTGVKKDIHEQDFDFLEKSYQAAIYASDKLGWKRICCYKRIGDQFELRSKDEIFSELLEVLKYEPSCSAFMEKKEIHA